MKRTAFKIIPVLVLVVLSLMIPLPGNSTENHSIKTVVILPFETNAQKDISYITEGILNMLHSRLFWKDNVYILRKDLTAKAISNSTQASARQISENQAIQQIGKLTNADYVITGIVTEFSNAFSVDSKVYNLKQGTFLTFFDQAKSIDQIISKTDIVAAKINKKIFNRTTISYEKFKKDKTITEEELRRMNPERMMPVRRKTDKEDSPWWKIW